MFEERKYIEEELNDIVIRIEEIIAERIYEKYNIHILYDYLERESHYKDLLNEYYFLLAKKFVADKKYEKNSEDCLTARKVYIYSEKQLERFIKVKDIKFVYQIVSTVENM